jgi:methyltransferase
MTGAVLLLAAVTLERLGELWVAQRNTKALLARGGLEVAPEHYMFIVLLHGAWLAGLWVAGWNQPLNLLWLCVFLVLQALRAWVLSTLGRRWTTRIIVVPGESLVVSGPYRWISHPNYVVVIGEIATLPLALGLPLYALVFSLANLGLLWIRVKAENAALSGLKHAPGS